MADLKIKFEPLDEGAKFFPPKPVKMELPNWYKNMNSSLDQKKATAKNIIESNSSTIFTIKRCVPVQDYLTSGYTLYLPFDLMFSVTRKDGGSHVQYYTTKDNAKDHVSNHPVWQFPMIRNGVNVWVAKIFSGWRIKTPPGYSCLIYPNFYQFEERIDFFPAIVDTDQYDDEIGYIGYFDCSMTKDFKLDAGTPFITIFPFKRDGWEMEIGERVIDPNKESKLRILSTRYFENLYRKIVHNKKTYN